MLGELGVSGLPQKLSSELLELEQRPPPTGSILRIAYKLEVYTFPTTG